MSLLIRDWSPYLGFGHLSRNSDCPVAGKEWPVVVGSGSVANGGGRGIWLAGS